MLASLEVPLKLLLLALVACGGPTEAPPAASPPEPEPEPAPAPAPAELEPALRLASEAGPITLTPVQHATTILGFGDTVVWLDPWSQAPLDAGPRADVVLITDIHPDHLDPLAIDAVAKPGAVLVGPQAVAEALEGRKVDHVLANGESLDLAGLRIEAVPMYNRVRGPEEGTLYHTPGRGNGYLITFGGKRIYIAGDTECTDEMRALTAVDLALVPMNLPYTMPPLEAAECVNAFRPAQVVPYHYRGSDTADFAAAITAEGVTVTRLPYYGEGAQRGGE